MFDDEKIKLIEAMPDRDTILIIWIKLLAQAGKCNATGYLLLNQNIPYTDEMLSTIFNRPLGTVRMALEIFNKFGMIDMEDDTFHVTNWEKHQNIEGMEKIKEKTRERVARHRANKKLLLESNVTCNATVTESNALDIDIELDIEKESTIYSPVISYLNEKAGTKYKSSTQKTKDLIKARLNDGFVLDDFKKVIDNKVSEWKGTEWEKFLRPETLFSNKFEGYLNQKVIKKDLDNPYRMVD
jgi:predicted phage replisome organizer/uncharacterized phage protein (TIGR02220 family)